MNRNHFIKNLIAIGAMGSISGISPLLSYGKSLNENDFKMPVLFMGHGSPMNAIEDNDFTKAWKALADSLPKPKAVLCISAHWLTRGTFVTAMDHPKTIHDFGGFPQALFNVNYPAPGSSEIAELTQKTISSTNVNLDHDWGLDHGAWSVVKQMYPNADVPVLQLSIDYHKPAQYHYNLAKELSALRKKGVLILGSGNMVHNLRLIRFPSNNSNSNDSTKAFGFDWAEQMNETFKKLILEKNHQELIDYHKMGKEANLAIPSPDHYFPLIYSLALQDKNESAEIFNDRCVMGSISMTSLLIK